MNNQIHTDTNRRHDFVLLFDATYSNPNGDPDNGGQPRVDPETMRGLVTDVALKRKVRDWVDMVKEGEDGYSIYVQHRGILANQQKRAFEALKHAPTTQPDEEARAWMCQRYYDIRLFGALMSMGKSGQKAKGGALHWNCGQVRGPVQLTFARSIDPVTVLDLTITRVALTNADDTLRGAESEEQEVASSGTMGRKAVIPYGLYMAHGYFSPQLARRTGVSEADLALFWEALEKLWDFDRSAVRPEMACQGLYVYSHKSSLGNAPAHQLLARVRPQRKEGVQYPRSVEDYEVTVDDADLPKDVTLTRLVG